MKKGDDPVKEYVYEFVRYGYFLKDAGQSTSFAQEPQARLIIEPQEYELKLSGEVLTKASCKGYTIEITDMGAARFFDWEGNLIASSEPTRKAFREFRFEWKQDGLRVIFGHKETQDNYPNCDGESDRWSTVWVADYGVALDTDTLRVKADML